MNLDLNSLVWGETSGAKTAPVFVRELTPEDDALLALPRNVAKRAPIKNLRARHHYSARLVASGEFTVPQVAAMTGYSESALHSMVHGDPSFQELVAFYKVQVEDVYLGLGARMAGLANDAAAILSERLEEDPKSFTNNMLRELMKDGADRTGFGPSSTQNTNVNVNFAEKLQLARERRQRMIDVTPQQAAE